MSGHTTTGADLALGPEEADVFAAVARDYAAALPPDRSAPYQALAQAAADGRIPDELLGVAERVAAVSLQTGRARRDGHAGPERLLADVYRRTPAGQDLTGRVREVNQALQGLAGGQLRAVRVAAPAPGRYTLTLEAGGATVTLTVDADGIGVRSLHVG